MTKRTPSAIAAMLRRQELQLALLAELDKGPRTMRELVAKFGHTRELIYNALDKLYDASMVDSITDRRTGADGLVIGATWVLSGRELPTREDHDMIAREAMQRKKALVIPPRDPLLWAVFGVAVEARP